MVKVKKNKKEEVKPSEKLDKLSKKAKAAAKELQEYMKANKLDPTNDYSKDKKHGKKIKELTLIINADRDKVHDTIKKEKKEKKEKKVAGATAKYDYPLVDGKPMTAEEKKKYRQKMRSEAKAANKPEKPSNPAMVEKKKKKKVEEPAPPAPAKKKDKDKKKKKKAVKEED